MHICRGEVKLLINVNVSCLKDLRLELQAGWKVWDNDHVYPVHAINCLLTAALRAEVLLQGCYVSVPAQSVDMLWIWGPVEKLKSFLVGLGGAEPCQVAA